MINLSKLIDWSQRNEIREELTIVSLVRLLQLVDPILSLVYSIFFTRCYALLRNIPNLHSDVISSMNISSQSFFLKIFLLVRFPSFYSVAKTFRDLVDLDLSLGVARYTFNSCLKEHPPFPRDANFSWRRCVFQIEIFQTEMRFGRNCQTDRISRATLAISKSDLLSCFLYSISDSTAEYSKSLRWRFLVSCFQLCIFFQIILQIIYSSSKLTLFIVLTTFLMINNVSLPGISGPFLEA